MAKNRKSQVTSAVRKGDLSLLLVQLEIQRIETAALIPVSVKKGRKNLTVLPYNSALTLAYAQDYCDAGNDCDDDSFESDCTHFMCHCLNAGGVVVSNASAHCASNLCIRVNDLAAAMSNSVNLYSNVQRIASHSDTRQGDFCFIPSWFGLRKEHVMLLASTASGTGARVYAHTNNRCNAAVEFEGAECTYYRINDA